MLKDNNNNWIEEGDEIKAMFQSHFKQLFNMETHISIWFQTNQSFHVLRNNVTCSLDFELNNSEIKQYLFDMVAWKSPGPNGPPAEFYQNTWNLTSENICSYIHSL